MRAHVASTPGFPVALPVWYRLPRAEREGTHHVQSSRAFELAPLSSELRQYFTLSIVTRAPCQFRIFQVSLSWFSVLFVYNCLF